MGQVPDDFLFGAVLDLWVAYGNPFGIRSDV
jgi:hypothetical protein